MIALRLLLCVIAALAIVILLRILIIVHRSAGRVKELEMRMKAMEKLDASDVAEIDKSDKTEE